MNGSNSQPRFILGTQYFRPPFPRAASWEDDFRKMKDVGLNAIQLWLVWGWCEPEQGKFVFDDYDRMMDLAQKHGLFAVLSLLPELNPFWLPRVLPEGLMIDIEGRQVPSGNRLECLSGLTPGLCSDHPLVRKKMIGFLQACGKHFGGRENLAAWDVWNENRWCNHITDYVCFCPHSVASFQDMLRERYGSLQGVGDAWGSRFCDWKDVRVGRLANASYPQMRDYLRWIEQRAARMAQWRVEAVRQSDPHHLVTTHAGGPTVWGSANLNEPLFNRGIDWDIAAGDAYGVSSFPYSKGTVSPLEMCVRFASISTVGNGKPVWMSELQGGGACLADKYQLPLPGDLQQAWLWTGISRGHKACVFWCWSNEVFGNETDGFGILSPDGKAEDRLKHLRRTADVLRLHEKEVAEFAPNPPQVGVLFSRDSYFHDWMASKSMFQQEYTAPKRLLAYPFALEKLGIPWAMLDDRHLAATTVASKLKLIIVPVSQGLDDAAAKWLLQFAESGGVVFVEGTAGFFGADTFMREANHRPLFSALGLRETQRGRVSVSKRLIPTGALGQSNAIEIEMDYQQIFLAPTTAAKNLSITSLEPDGAPLLATAKIGRGCVIVFGGLLGKAMVGSSLQTPERMGPLLRALLAEAKVTQDVDVQFTPAQTAATSPDLIHTSARLGRSGEHHMLIVTNFGQAGDVSLKFASDAVAPSQLSKADEWFGHSLKVSQHANETILKLTMSAHDQCVMCWPV